MGTNVTQLAPDVYGVGAWGFTQTNVYLVRSGASWVLIDAGWARDGPRIEQAIRPVLGGVRPTAVLLTHCHPDHSGAAGELARRWGCPVWMHPKELPIATGDFAAMQAWAGPLDRWVILPMMSVIGRQRRETGARTRQPRRRRAHIQLRRHRRDRSDSSAYGHTGSYEIPGTRTGAMGRR